MARRFFKRLALGRELAAAAADRANEPWISQWTPDFRGALGITRMFLVLDADKQR